MSSELPKKKTKGKPSKKPLTEWHGSDVEPSPEKKQDAPEQGKPAAPVPESAAKAPKSEADTPSSTQVSSVDKPRASAPKKSKTSTRAQEIIKGLEQSAPLLFVGGGLLVVAVLLWGVPSHIGGRTYPLYIVFLLIGAVALTGGTIASLVPEEDLEGEIPKSTEKYVVVKRRDWVEKNRELSKLQAMLKNALPKEAVSEAGPMTTTVAKSSIPATSALAPPLMDSDIASALDEIQRALDIQGEEVASVTIGTSAQPKVETPTTSVSESPVPETKSAPTVVPASQSQPVIAAAPETLPPTEKPAVPVKPLEEVVEAPPSEQSSITYWEVAAFRTARTTAVIRNPAETARDYVMRSTLEAGKSGGRVPDLSKITRALSANLTEAYKELSKRQTSELSSALGKEGRQFVQDAGIPRNARESLVDYVDRVDSLLESATKAKALERRIKVSSAGVRAYMPSFRNFLESYLGRRATDDLAKSVEVQAASQGEVIVSSSTQADGELLAYAQMLRGSLGEIQSDTLTSGQLDRLLSAFDTFVQSLKGKALKAEWPYPGEDTQPRSAPKAPDWQETPAEGEIAPEKPVPRQTSQPKAVVPSVTNMPKSELKAGQAPPSEPSPPTGPSQRDDQGLATMSPTDWEMSAFRAAFATGVSRKEGEKPAEFLERVRAATAGKELKPTPLELVSAVSSSLTEARRSLPEKQMDDILRHLDDTVEGWAGQVKVPRNPGEQMLEYALRAKDVLETVAKTATEAVPERELAGLKWSLTLFRGFLEGYLGQQETARIVNDVESEAKSRQGGPGRRPVGTNDVLTYGTLVKNALKSLSSRGVEKERIDSLLVEFDEFVKDVTSTGPAVPGLGQSRKEVASQAPNKMKQMFDWLAEEEKEQK